MLRDRLWQTLVPTGLLSHVRGLRDLLSRSSDRLLRLPSRLTMGREKRAAFVEVLSYDPLVAAA
ncbi:MAG TPA: hypothetical protein VKA37_14005, partial [Halobacteriales archaeon]|nr:hypothetical protein [Halobacteriales archaeon]